MGRLLCPYYDGILGCPPSTPQLDQVIRSKVTRVCGEIQRRIQELDVRSATCDVSTGYTHGLLARSETAGVITGHDATSEFLARCHACR